MSHQALRNTTPEQLKRRALNQVENRMSRLLGEPVRNIRQRREAFDTMLHMLRRTMEQATATGKPSAVIGEDFYVKHNAEFFEVWVRGGSKVFVSDLLQVVSLFDAEKFVSGHVTD